MDGILSRGAFGMEALGDAAPASGAPWDAPPTPQPAFKPVRDGLQRFTAAEVGCHDRRDDAWIAVGGRVYDVTDLLAAGGTPPALLRALGTEMTKDAFAAATQMHAVAWDHYYIGDIVSNPALSTGLPRHRRNMCRVRWPSEESLVTDIDEAITARTVPCSPQHGSGRARPPFCGLLAAAAKLGAAAALCAVARSLLAQASRMRRQPH